MQPSRFSYCLLGAFLSLLFALRWFQQFNMWTGVLILFYSGLLFLLIATREKYFQRVWLSSAAILIGCTLALWSVARTTHISSQQTVDYYADQTFVTVRGVIAAEPDRRPLSTKYTIAVEEIQTRNGTVIFPVTGRILATDRRQWPEFRYGQRVRVRGVLEKPGLIEEFEYDKYLSRYDIYAVMYSASVTAVNDVKSPLSFIGTMYGIKERFESQINRLYPEPHAAFMAGLLTGSRRGISQTLLQNFNRTGLTHIVAISGYNITIVVSIITALLFWLPLRWRFVPAVGAIALFTLFVGASAAVVRAAVMGCLGLLALQLGRQAQVRLTVLWTACLMLVWNPKLLWYDAGFQLSFLAVLGLTELGPLLERWFKRITPLLGIRESLQMTTAAQLSAVPLTILLFGRFSLIAPFANVLVAPFVPLAMLFGFLGTVVSFFAFLPGQLLSILSYGCLQWIILVTKILAAVPFASVDAPGIHITILILYYVCLVTWIARTSKPS